MFIFLLPLSLLLVYAQLSHPWPKNPSFAEISTALIMFIMLIAFEIALKKRASKACLSIYNSTLILVIVTSVSGLVGIPFFSPDSRSILRDVFPNLFYLIIPYFVYSIQRLRLQIRDIRIFNSIIGLVIMSTSSIIAYRAFIESSIELSRLGSEFFRIGQTFRQYDPFVTFVMAFSPFFLIYLLQNTFHEKKIYLKAFYFISSVYCLFSFIAAFSTLIAIGQRAPVMYPVLGISLFLLPLVIHINLPRISRSLLIVLLLGVGTFTFLLPRIDNLLLTVIDNILSKNQQTGFLDQKFIEFFALISDPFLVFPRGFGANYSNPSIGGATLRFTHSAFSYFYLKFGIFGLATLSWYIYKINCITRFSKFFLHSFKTANIFNFGFSYGFICTLFSAFMLQPTYKTLGFSILVSLVIGYTLSIHSKTSCLNTRPVKHTISL